MKLTRRKILAGLGTASLLAAGRAAASGLDPDATVRALAGQTRALYHDEAMANRLADHLLAQLQLGTFRVAADPGRLAEQLNRQIGAISGDLHFVVMGRSMGRAGVPPTPPHSPVPPLSKDELDLLTMAGFGIAAAEILVGNVGRLDLGRFYRPAPQVRTAIGEAMTRLAGTSALVVDLSRNPGGDPRAVAHLLSYFFDRPPFVVNRFHWRNRPVEEFRTERELDGPRYGEVRPLVVQVSAATFSAAEEFAYAVQSFRRGLVVGETTGGGANHALPVDLPGGLQAYIPQARAENPVTRSNWERTGVRPDLSASPSEASRAAHQLALDLIEQAGGRGR